MKNTAFFLLIIALSFSFFSQCSFADAEDDQWIGPDKISHFVAGCTLQIITYNFYRKNMESEDKAEVAAFFTSVGLGAIKELIDDEFDWKDMVWNTAGAGIGVVINFEF